MKADQTVPAAPMEGDPTHARQMIERACAMLATVRECGAAAADLMPNTADADPARAVLEGQAALCDKLRELLDCAAPQLDDMAHRQRVIRDAQRALRDDAANVGSVAA